MRKQFKLLALASLAFVSVVAVTTSTIAWFKYAGNITFGSDPDAINVTGGSIAQHYKSGNGTEGDPYIIATRNHLYNLAWLQYIGTYNDTARNGVGVQQLYFKLDDDIEELDCQGLTLPPIGTETFPFFGHFDGNGKVISNFTISNDDPADADSDFGVAKPSQRWNGQPSQIVGFFGVVGALPDATYTFSPSYSSSVVAVEDFTLKDFTVKSETEDTLIGLAAGYVDGEMSGVKVDGDASLDISGTTHTALGGKFNNISDYGLVGYTTNSAAGGEYLQKLSKFYDNGGGPTGGSGNDWGGSIAISDLNHNLYNIFRDTSNYTLYTVNSNKRRWAKYEGDNVTISLGRGGDNLNTYYASDPDSSSVIYLFLGNGQHQKKWSTSGQTFSATLPGTYIPISFDSDLEPLAVNTGYIVSDTSQTTSYSLTSKDVYATVRSASYKIGHISNAYSTNQVTNAQAYSSTAQYISGQTEILTNIKAERSGTDTSDFGLIQDSYNSSHTIPSTSAVYAYRNNKQTWSTLELDKYDTVRTTIHNKLNGKSFVHGIHFMDATISKESGSTITIPTAYINNTTIDDFVAPKNCIDFTLKEEGYIKCFAGSYYDRSDSTSYADSFFSLHKITRSGSSITSIQEIKKIYKASSGEGYVYSYDGNKPSGAGDCVFDMSFLTGTPPVNNALYYFQIPVNSGEYALGSVSGKTGGAYLMYLDIGSANKLKDGVKAYSITTKSNSNAYPFGVDFSPINVSGEGGDTIAVSIASNKSGVLSFTVSTSNISVTDASSVASYAYRSTNYVASNPSASEFTCNMSGAPPGLAAGGVRVMSITLVTVTNPNHTHHIQITDIMEDDVGTYSESASTYQLATDGANYSTSSKSAIEDLSEEINLTALRSLEIATVLTRLTGRGEFVTTYDEANCNANTLDVDIILNGSTLTIDITSGYTFKIGGVTKADGSTYSG